MQVHVLVRVGVIQAQAGCGKGAILRADFCRKLAADGGAEAVSHAEAELVGRELAGGVHEIRRSGGICSRTFDDDQVQADPQVRQGFGTADGIGRGWAGYHQAGGAEDALAVRLFDGFVDAFG